MILNSYLPNRERECLRLRIDIKCNFLTNKIILNKTQKKTRSRDWSSLNSIAGNWALLCIKTTVLKLT